MWYQKAAGLESGTCKTPRRFVAGLAGAATRERGVAGLVEPDLRQRLLQLHDDPFGLLLAHAQVRFAALERCALDVDAEDDAAVVVIPGGVRVGVRVNELALASGDAFVGGGDDELHGLNFRGFGFTRRRG